MTEDIPTIRSDIDDKNCREYIENNDLDGLRGYLNDRIRDGSLEKLNLVTIAKINTNTAGLVKEFVNSGQIDESVLANQIANEIIADMIKYVDSHLSKYQKYTLSTELISSSASEESTSQFFNLISLLRDVSLLGRKLLESAPQINAQKTTTITGSSIVDSDGKPALSIPKSGKSLNDEDATSEDLLAALIESSSTDDFLVLSSSLESISMKDMMLAALIYIKSHECFTLSHDIQGVAMVLRRTKFIILNILAPRNQMELITKLLTSIGRYSLMKYVFDLFRDRNQFEILLSKGVEKSPELRIALFNYVKKNPEFYALVTLNFSMFREIAESLEASAIKRLNKLISAGKKKSISGSGSKKEDIANDSDEAVSRSNRSLYPKESLNLCLIELIDASDCSAKAGCYKKSNHCERKAKLVALQMALLPEEKDLLDLQESELNNLIVSLPSFSNAYIVVEAYECQLAWRQALFNNVVLKGKGAYLEDFCKKCDLSTALVEEIVLLYKQHISTNSGQLSEEESSHLAKGMKMLLLKLDNVELKCKIYSQLNFDDAKEELLQDEAVRTHLQDLKLV